MGTDYNFNFDSKNGSIQDPLSFLQDDNFDLALAFGDPSPTGNEAEADPISLLTTEESIYDPLTNNSDKLCSTVKADDVNTDFNFNDFVKIHYLKNKRKVNMNHHQHQRLQIIMKKKIKMKLCRHLHKHSNVVKFGIE